MIIGSSSEASKLYSWKLDKLYNLLPQPVKPSSFLSSHSDRDLDSKLCTQQTSSSALSKLKHFQNWNNLVSKNRRKWHHLHLPDDATLWKDLENRSGTGLTTSSDLRVDVRCANSSFYKFIKFIHRN